MQSQEDIQSQPTQIINRQIKKKEAIPSNIPKRNCKQPIKKVVNPFEKQQSSSTAKTQNKVIETIGSNRFAELLSKYNGNGNTIEKPQTEVKSYEKSAGINQKIESLLSKPNQTENKQSTVIDEVSEMRKKTLKERQLQKEEENEEGDDDNEFNDASLDLSEEDNQSEGNHDEENTDNHKEAIINEKTVIENVIKKKSMMNNEGNDDVDIHFNIQNDDEEIV